MGAPWVPDVSPYPASAQLSLQSRQDPEDPLSRRLTQSSLSSQLAAVSFLKHLCMEGAGRLDGAHQGEGRGKELLTLLEVRWLFGWTVGMERCARDPSPDSCSRVTQPEALCAVMGVGTARFLAGAYAWEAEARLSIPSCGGCVWVSCLELSKDGNHLERRVWVAQRDKVTPVQGHLD